MDVGALATFFVGGQTADVQLAIAAKLLRMNAQAASSAGKIIEAAQQNMNRLANVAAISAEDAMNYNLVGPNLRASGINWDVRKNMPYSVYPDFDFEIPVGSGEWGTTGDAKLSYTV